MLHNNQNIFKIFALLTNILYLINIIILLYTIKCSKYSEYICLILYYSALKF